MAVNEAGKTLANTFPSLSHAQMDYSVNVLVHGDPQAINARQDSFSTSFG
jgi:hypothetical protein